MFYIDPLDGTQSFINRQRNFGILLGEVKNGLPKTGVCYFPHEDDRTLWIGDVDHEIALQGKQQKSGEWQFTVFRKGITEAIAEMVINEPFPSGGLAAIPQHLAEPGDTAEISKLPAAATILETASTGKIHMRADHKGRRRPCRDCGSNGREIFFP